MSERSRPEFDAYAAAYAAGMEHPVKRLLGGSFEAFVRVKATWLKRELIRNPPLAARGGPRLLDFGCGTGEFLQALARDGFEGTLAGCDVSPGMLAEARRRWRAGALPPLYVIAAGEPALPAGAWDVVVASGVLHHVAPRSRGETFQEMARLLRPGGRLVVFEHNPRNPLTRAVVRRTAIDRNAVLLDAAEVRRSMNAGGFSGVRVEYILFVPPRLPGASRLERRLGWLPLGGQYAAVGTKTG